jgi:hypothetical protein
MAPPQAQDTMDAPSTPEKFVDTIVDAIAAGAVKVEVFAEKTKLKIRIFWT